MSPSPLLLGREAGGNGVGDHDDDSGSGFSAANLSCASTASWISGKGMGTFLKDVATRVISMRDGR